MEQKFITDKQGNKILPITHIDAVRDSNGNTLTSKLGTAAGKDVPSSGNASSTQVVMGNDSRLTDARPASDVSSWAKASTKPSYTKAEINLGNVDNTSDADKKTAFTGSIANGNTGFVTGGDAYTALTGKADLVNGVIPESQLPSYVDDVIELLAVSDTAPATCAKGDLYYNTSTKKIVRATGANTCGTGNTTNTDPESGKIYINLTDSKTYRWGGSSSGLVVISETLALGETSGTAYRGDRGKTAYDHSQSTHARTDATKTEASSTNGNIKINGSETTVYTHPTSTAASAAAVKVGNDAQGHVVIGSALTASDVSAVSTVASQGLSNTQKSHARTNIGAGTYSKPSNGIPASDLADDAKEHEYVDLGLPSGLLWAVDYYNSTNFSNHPYVFADQVASYYQQYGVNLLDHWGQGWRVPTKEEFEELISTSNVTISNNGNENYTITSKTNGNTLNLSRVGTPSSDYVSAGVCIWSNSIFSYSGSFYYLQLYGQITNNSWINQVNIGTGKEALVLLVHDPFPVSPAKVKDALGINSSIGSTTKYLNEQGSFTTIASDSGKQDKITASGLLKGNGSGTVSAAVAGTDYQAPLSFNTTPSSSNKVATMSDVFHSIPANVSTAFVDLTDTSAGNANYVNLDTGTYTIGRDTYSETLVNFSNLTASCSAIQFKAGYSDGDGLYIRKTVDGNRISGPWRLLLSDQNIGNYALPLTGGTIKGQFTLVPDASGTYDYAHAIYAGFHGIDHTDFYENQFNFYYNNNSTPGTTPMLQIDRTNGTIVNSNLKSISFRTTSKEITEEGGRICIGSYGQSTAEGLSAGSLLISNAWADASYVPTNGIYSKGAIIAPAFKQVYTNPTTATSYTISPNVEYFLNTITANTTFTLGSPDNSVVNEYKFQFDMGSTAYTIDGLSASIIWQGGVPSFEANKHYEISIKAVPATWSDGSPATWRYFGLCSSFDLT